MFRSHTFFDTIFLTKGWIRTSFYTITKKVTLPDGTRKIINARVTDRPVEGRNKYIKILLNLANGYTNFDRFRNQAMYVLNKREAWSETKLENNIPHRMARHSKRPAS